MTDSSNATTNPFRTLFKIDVAQYVEKKGQFSYLSWPFAVSQLRLADPSATWEVKRFDGLPYLICDVGDFDEHAVTVTRFWKQGNVDYKKVPELAGVALDAYRGKAREEVRVSVK